MKTILSTAIVLASSIIMAAADVAAKSHEEIGKQTAAVMTEMINGIAKINDKAGADAFAATMPDIKEKMKVLLKAAQALPAPTEEEKTAVNKMMKAAKEEAAPKMEQAMMNMVQNPEAEAIGMVLAQVMGDPEMIEAGEALEKIYKQQEEEDGSAPSIE